VIFLEDDDVAAVTKGSLTVHRIKRSLDESSVREVITLKMQLQEIMKGMLAFARRAGTTERVYMCL